MQKENTGNRMEDTKFTNLGGSTKNPASYYILNENDTVNYRQRTHL